MKPGAGDDPFADDGGDSTGGSRTTVESTVDATQRNAEIPYVFRRDTVKEGRDQIPIFLREHVQEGERDLRRTLENELGEDVSKTDLREAAMVAAQRNPELVAQVLREWGYDYE